MPRQIIDGVDAGTAVAAAGSDSNFGGNGGLGDVTIAAPTDVAGVVNYDTLTIETAGLLGATAGQLLQVLVKTALIIQGNGALHADGRGSGAPGTGASGSNGEQSSGSVVVGGAGAGASAPGTFDSTAISASGAGGGGGSGAQQGTVVGADGGTSANGRDRDATYLTTLFGQSAAGAGAGGVGAVHPGAGAGGTGGGATNATAVATTVKDEIQDSGMRDWHLLFNGGCSGSGGSGGSGGADDTLAGVDGLGGTTTVVGSQTGINLGDGQLGSNGIDGGGNAGGGGGGGSAAWGGGRLYVEVAGDVDLSASGRISADGGDGGAGGNGAGGTARHGGGGGGGGGGGSGGWVVLFYNGTDVNTTVDAAHFHADGGAGGGVGLGGVGSLLSGGAGGAGSVGEDGFVLFRKVG